MYSKKRLYLALSLLCIALLLSCGGAKKKTEALKITQNPPFSVSKAFFQKWGGGVQSSGSGINLQITFNALPKTITIKKIYFKGMVAEAIVLNLPQTTYTAHYRNQRRPDIIMDNDPIKEAVNTPTTRFPFMLEENEAVVSYVKEGDLYYAKVLNIAEKPMIAYPEQKKD
jgi:hypothetical protein